MVKLEGQRLCDSLPLAMDSLLECGVLWSFLLDLEVKRLLRLLEWLHNLSEDCDNPGWEEFPTVSAFQSKPCLSRAGFSCDPLTFAGILLIYRNFCQILEAFLELLYYLGITGISNTKKISTILYPLMYLLF